MDLTSFRLLLSPGGQEVLQAAESLAPREADYLAHFGQLSRRYPASLAQAALETAILRREAATKFPEASQMYFTREALEQATSFSISSYRARRFAAFQRLADLGCSIGGDTLALAALAPTLGLDLDPLRLELARANLVALGLGANAQFLRADLKQPVPLRADPDLALFFDPARRAQAGGARRRAFSVHAYQPPLSALQSWLERFPALGAKISPGVDLAELAGYEAEIEFISLNGELKEAALWFGPLITTKRRATLLPGVHTLTSERQPATPLALSEPLDYIYEPDPAILRAGLVAELGWQLQAAQLDPDIAYLTADQHRATPFARCWQVDAWFPFQLKRLREALRQRGVGQATIKKRGSPLQPEALLRQLRLSGGEQRLVFLTHLRGRPIAILAYP